ncbi:helix-turn-helix transcriptional regulator [Candidatus Bipolaricaulota bacterium]|nr:helix-turn-helix transcriptional regulator [Candidatus Bipolaricaulota bacterium]MCK5585921.1 helix-turn-helix transcriptional regulator [Candidatus Bipolaricaulota bacterium]
MARFGDKIKELRQKLGLTQWQVADRTGVSNTYISALESGRKPAPPHVIVTALAACLEISEEALWNLARAEREERLKQRIDGIPTSQRTARSPESAFSKFDANPSNAVLEQAIQALRETAQDPKQRRLLARALETLAKSLRGKD